MNNTSNNDISKKWQMLLWKVFCIAAIIIMVFEIVGAFRYHGDIEDLSKTEYVLKNVVLPGVLYVVALLITMFLLNKKKFSEDINNWIISTFLMVLVLVPTFQHYDVLPFIFLPSIIVIATCFFANQNISAAATVVAILTVVINDIRLKNLYAWDNYNFAEWVAGSVFMVIIVSVIVMMVNSHTKDLVLSIEDSTVKQMNLMKELKKDPLTSLYNRRSFEESLEKEVQMVEETGKKSFIAIFDIDHFKNVNDTYGHSNGDIVIKALCKMLKEKSKDCGLAFRYGGEEFVILFSDVELPKVINVVEDIRTEFRCYYFQFMNDSGITCSCGVAEYMPGESTKAWFNRADSSLYKAKEAGRNRTVISE